MQDEQTTHDLAELEAAERLYAQALDAAAKTKNDADGKRKLVYDRLMQVLGNFRTTEERIACIEWVIRQLPSANVRDHEEWFDCLREAGRTSDATVATAARELSESYLKER